MLLLGKYAGSSIGDDNIFQVLIKFVRINQTNHFMFPLWNIATYLWQSFANTSDICCKFGQLWLVSTNLGSCDWLVQIWAVVIGWYWQHLSVSTDKICYSQLINTHSQCNLLFTQNFINLSQMLLIHDPWRIFLNSLFCL